MIQKKETKHIKTQRKFRLSNTISFILIFTLLLLSSSITIYWVLQSLNDFEKRSSKIRNDYVESQKAAIRREVERIVDMIEYEKSQTELKT